MGVSEINACRFAAGIIYDGTGNRVWWRNKRDRRISQTDNQQGNTITTLMLLCWRAGPAGLSMIL